MRVVSLVVHLLPTLAVMTLAWLVVRAVSVRVVWRHPGGRPFDDEPA